MSGTFLTKVFEGPFSAAPKWIKQMEACVGAQGKRIRTHYFHYTTCPNCAKLRGKNYVAAFAEVE